MSPAVEQNIMKRMKKQSELILKPRMKGSTISRASRKKDVTSGITNKNDSFRSLSKIAKNNSADVSPRQINQIAPSPAEGEVTGIRYVAYPIATTVPFNRTLSTSTPDPEKQATPKQVSPEGATSHSVPVYDAADQYNQKKPPPHPPPIITKVKSAKLQQIVQNQTKTAQRKTLSNSHFKPTKMKPTSIRQSSHQLKSQNKSQVSSTNIPPSTTQQNAVSFSIHQVNKVASVSQNLVSSQNSAFHQVVYNTSKMPNTNQSVSSSQKMVKEPCRQTRRSKSPDFFPGNTQDIAHNIYTTQSSNTNLFSQPPDIQTAWPRSVPHCISSKQPPFELAAVPLDSNSSPSRFTPTSCSGTNFNLYSQDQRLPQYELHVSSPRYVTAQTTTSNRDVLPSVNQDGQAMNTVINHIVQTEHESSELHRIATPGQAFVPSDFQSRHHENQGLVPFEEPVRDSDAQTKSISSQEYFSYEFDAPLNKMPHSNIPGSTGTAATKIPESSCPASVEEGVKNIASDKYSSQNSYVQQANSCMPNLPPLQWQSVEALAGAKTLRFMINELEEISRSTNASEINRLVKQIQQIVTSLPQLSDTFDLQTEIALALQPLRNENSQLRRRLRIFAEEASQEKEKIEADQRRQTLELQLQLLNLEKRVDEEKLSKHQQLQQQEELVKELSLLKMERQSLVKDLDQRETTQFDMRRENWEDNRKYLREIEILQKEIEQKVLALEAAEKKNHILQITLEQRDMEISRMHEILLSAREEMKELIYNLCQSKDIATPSEGIEKFFNFITQDPTLENSSSLLKNVSTVDSAATLTDSWTAPVNSNNASNTNVRKAALESSVDKRLQALLDNMKISCQHQTLGKGIKQTPRSPLVNNPSSAQTNFSKKDNPGSQNQEISQTSCPPSDIKDSGFGASPDTENVIPSSNGITAQVFNTSADVLGSLQESSADVTRASITDYFAKYPKSQPKEQCSSDAAESGKEGGSDGEGCLNARQISNKIMQNILNKNQNLFTETTASELDISSISQCTVTTLSSLTGDVRTFRQGLASLDANIARLQASIKTSKNTFST